MSKSVTFEMFALLSSHWIGFGLDESRVPWYSSVVMKYIQHLASHCPVNYAAVCIVG